MRVHAPFSLRAPSVCIVPFDEATSSESAKDPTIALSVYLELHERM